MKRQELFDETLKSKLKDFESEPPAFVFDKIVQELDQKQLRKLSPWWKSQKVAAAIAILFVSGAVYWVNSSPELQQSNQLAMPLENNQQLEKLEQQIGELEQKAQVLAQALEEKNASTMQPAPSSKRLEDKQSIETVAIENQVNKMEVTPISIRQAVVKMQKQTMPDLMAATFELYPDESQFNREEMPLQASNSAIVNTFSKLTSGAYLNLAKHKVNEFVTKEHYVNFAIGNVEFGQTIQLSK